MKYKTDVLTIPDYILKYNIALKVNWPQIIISLIISLSKYFIKQSLSLFVLITVLAMLWWSLNLV